MEECDIGKTAFRTGTGGLYEYTRMLFWLCNGQGTFMRVMDKAFGDLNFQILVVYLDDILVFRSTFKETLFRLEPVLSNLNPKFKPEKCQLFANPLPESRGYTREPLLILKRCERSEWPRPVTLRDLGGFLGLSGYYRRFLKGYAEVAVPLQRLLQGQKLKTKFCGFHRGKQTSFQQIQTILHDFLRTGEYFNFRWTLRALSICQN